VVGRSGAGLTEAAETHPPAAPHLLSESSSLCSDAWPAKPAAKPSTPPSPSWHSHSRRLRSSEQLASSCASAPPDSGPRALPERSKETIPAVARPQDGAARADAPAEPNPQDRRSRLLSAFQGDWQRARAPAQRWGLSG
jgi:hypothetical protein